MPEHKRVTISAKEEFLKHIEGKPPLKCAAICNYDEDGAIYSYTHKDKTEALLPPNYLQEEYQKFLDLLDFQYYNGFGCQELYGVIWYQDGTWSERHEYVGAEDWRYKKCPEFPNKIDIKGDSYA